jgi:hypothetical protein
MQLEIAEQFEGVFTPASDKNPLSGKGSGFYNLEARYSLCSVAAGWFNKARL